MDNAPVRAAAIFKELVFALICILLRLSFPILGGAYSPKLFAPDPLLKCFDGIVCIDIGYEPPPLRTGFMTKNAYIRPVMEMHQVRYFLAVADELNFTRAAERCHVAQPSLTRAIKLLEEELGGPLFHRERANTHLSELGCMVKPYLVLDQS